MAYILTTIVLWTTFFLLTPTRDFRKYYPILILAALIGTVADLLGVYYDQWIYHGPVVGGLSLWSDLGIAPAEAGLYIRFFPARSSTLPKLGYVCGWSLLNAIFEWAFVWVGWIGYDHWNPVMAFLFYVAFFGILWVHETWYNGTGRLR